MIQAVAVCLAFALGSFPTGLVLTRTMVGKDIRQVGSGNIGAANVTRAVGIKVGALVAVVDILKGVAPVLIGRALGLDEIWLAAVAAAAVLGHDFSIFLRFRGGKGVATTLGALLALAPLATVLGMAVWVAALLLWRYSSLASLIALALLPALLILTRQPISWILLAVGLFLLSAAKHYQNILRLARGQEVKFKRPSAARA